MKDYPLLRLVPPVLRARDFHLYLQGGRRLTDLWQYGGAAVLGHTPPHILGELKNTANRGLFTPFPHPLEHRLIKALSAIFPESVFRVYADEATLRQALSAAGYAGDRPFADPVFTPDGSPPVLWRPFLQESPSPQPSLCVPLLPWALAPQVLVIGIDDRPFPPSELLSPVLLAATVRSLYDLIAALPERGKAVFPLITEALGTWRRKGIYLHYAEPLDEAQYSRLFLHFLEGGFLLPPSPEQPLILPGALSPGEQAKLAELLGFLL
ncbi:MAG: hypothetical protein LBU17_05285 [Treponema sp.]|jgi:hypothetical protein|nr:hypothetical protein [Treponema sp.]